MMTIEQETENLIAFLRNPAGFSVDMAGQVIIRPIYQTIDHWEVSWFEEEDGLNLQLDRIFLTVEEAAIFFVEKRRYLCLGSDFNKMYEEESKEDE